MLDYSKTNPGFHKEFNIHSFPIEEQAILRKLSKEWYITNSGYEISLGNSKFRSFLMKPTPIFSEMFNIDREIVCVFSPYDNFEPRTLDAFDVVASKFQSLRIENVCRVLISKDTKTEEKITNILKIDPEQPIVIPFSYGELEVGFDDYFIRNRFRKHFYSRDLFSFSSPLKKDLYFFGRSDLIQEIVNRHKSGEHSGLFGLRKSGKTSIVYAIERFMDSHDGFSITFDCESPSIHKLRWNELLQYIAEQYKVKHHSSYNVSPLQKYSEKKAAITFEKDMLEIYKEINKPTLLIFDEIERISPRTGSSEHWRNGDDFVYFWQTLRYFFQKNSGVITYMLAGTNPNCVEIQKLGTQDNPLFSSIPFQYVPTFNVAKTREMVRKLGKYMGLKFDELIYSKLTEDFGGHPFLIRQFCSVINSLSPIERPVNVDKALYEKAKERFFINSRHYIEMVIQVLQEWYPDEYDMLILLANNETSYFNGFANDGNYYTNHLIGYGLIDLSPNGYSFKIEIVKQYLVERYKFEKTNLSPEKMNLEILERRSLLEIKLRKIIKNQLKSSYGKEKAVDKVLFSLPENRRLGLIRKSIDEILDPNDCPLYFNELISIISHEWQLFIHVFETDKSKVIFMLEEINRFRKDAHSNTISKTDFSELRIYFSRLEEILQDWG